MPAPLRETLPKAALAARPDEQKPPKESRFPHPLIIVALTAGVFIAAQLVAYFFLALITSVVGSAESSTENLLVDNTLAQFVYLVIANGLVFGMVWRLLKGRGLRLKDIGMKRPKKNVAMVAVLGLICFYLLAGVLGGIILKLLPEIPTNQEQNIGFEGVTGLASLSLVFASLVIIVPLGEEILTRGYLFSGLRARLNFFWTLLITSALFGIAHLQTASDGNLSWALVINIFFLAVVLGYLREKTGTIWAGVILHGLNNCVAFLIRFSDSIF